MRIPIPTRKLRATSLQAPFTTSPSARPLRVRALLVGLVFALVACASDNGCQGCDAGKPIPGGFPQQHRFDNAGQIRLSQSGVTYLEQNFEKLLESFMTGGLNFTIPPSGCNGDPKVCCGTTTCKATIDITTVDLTPQAGGRLNLKLKAKVTTNQLDFQKDLWVYWLKCNATYNTSKSSPNTVGLVADVDLVIDANNGNKLKIERKTMTVEDFDCGDLDIGGGVDCTIASWLCPLFKNTLLSGVQGPMEQAIDDILKTIPTGTEARYDLAALLQTFSPSAQGEFDYLVWGGGYAQGEAGGVSAGVLGGFRATQHNPCVPNCEKAGASCSPPAKAAIPRSNIFRGNLRPDGKTFHVGIGVHRQTLDHAAYGLYSSGALCLDVSSELSTQLNSGLFSLLVPSLNVLTSAETVPVKLAIRPQKPPTVSLGAGTWHTDKDGNPVIDEPLVKIAAKDFSADVYALVEERWIRLFTITGDLEVPALVTADSQGRLQPMLGDLSKALTNIKVANSELLSEDPSKLATLFPTILNVAAGMFSTNFDPIALPDFAGIKLGLDKGSITSVDNNDLLAIFSKLELTQSTSAPGDLLGPRGQHEQARVETRARVVHLQVPDTAAFAITHPSFRAHGGPAVTLALDAVVPAELAHRGQSLEWSVRLDGGFWRPWSDARQMVFRDPRLWLQGAHRLEIKARLAGEHRTADTTPVVLPLIIDTVKPKVRLERSATGLRARVSDLVTPAEKLKLRWVVDGREVEGAVDAEGLATIDVSPHATVELRLADQAGNTTELRTQVADVELPGADRSGGCAVSGANAGGLLSVLAMLALALLMGRRRRR